MMKRLTAMALAIMLVLSMSTAFAWVCPNCGADMESKFCAECGAKKPENICPGCGANHGDKQLKFCTECGTKMDAAAPTAAPTATPAPEKQGPVIQDIFENGNGTVSIMWDADGTTKYTIECVQRRSDDPWADRAAKNGFYTSQSKYSIGFYTISRLIPGERYWIGVFDAEGKGDFVAFDPKEQPAEFSEFPVSLEAKLMVEENGVQTEADHLTAKEIMNGAKVGLYLAMPYENPGEAKEYLTQIVLKSSDGSRWVMAGYASFAEKSSNVTGWKFLDLKDYFDRMQACFGTVFMGNYSVSVYVNGALVGSQGFRVEQKEASQATEAPTQAPADDRAYIDVITDNGDGTATITWYGGAAPYTVQYLRKMTDDFNADRSAAREAGDYWNAASNVEGSSLVLDRLIPGVEYWIVVLDANSKGQRREFTGSTGDFTDFPVTLELNPREKIGETPADIACIPADAAGAEDDVSHGMFLKINHSNPGEAVDLRLQIVTSFTNGFDYVYGTSVVNFAAGEDRWRKWEFYTMEDLMAHLKKYNGSIPEGDVTVRIYLDGKLAATGTLPVGTAKPLTISGCTLLTNGYVRLIWKDNGCGPYNVYYHERFSDDVEADRTDTRGSGRWIVEEGVTEATIDMKSVVPGKDYWITVTDSTGSKAYYAYTGGAVGTSSMNMSAEASYVARVGEEISALPAFSAAEIKQSGEIEYGLDLSLSYTAPSEETTIPAMWVLTLPDGVSFCEYSFNLNLFPGGSTYWDCYTLDWAFDNVERWYGEVLTGEYTFTLYLKGEYACSLNFTVGE